MNPVTPAARWSPAMHAQRRFIGQAPAPSANDILNVLVQTDGAPTEGVAVEVMLQNGDTKTGVTDSAGAFALPYTAAQRGQAVVRITPPEGVEDIGEASVQGADLKGGPIAAQFALVSAPSEGSPVVGLAAAGVLYGLVLGAF
jgi:hypothetical protein